MDLVQAALGLKHHIYFEMVVVLVAIVVTASSLNRRGQ